MANLVVTKSLESNVYSASFTVSGLSTTESALIEDFGEPTVTFGGTIDVTSECTPIVVTGASGTFTVGETVTAAPSGASGTLFYADIDDLGAGTLYIYDIGATPFAGGDTLTGGTSGETATYASTGADVTQFEARYGVAPESTANFTVTTITRRITSSFNGTTFSRNGNLIAEAEENMNDLIAQVKAVVEEAWSELIAKVDNFEGTDTYPLP